MANRTRCVKQQFTDHTLAEVNAIMAFGTGDKYASSFKRMRKHNMLFRGSKTSYNFILKFHTIYSKNTEIDQHLFSSPTSEFGWISKVHVNRPAVERHAEQIKKWKTVKGKWQVSALFMHSVPVFLKQSLSLSRLQYWIFFKIHVNLKDVLVHVSF